VSKVTGVALGANQDGRLELVATTGEDEGEPGDVWHAWQETPGGDWSGWHLLGPAGEIVFHGPPAVAGHADGRLHVAATGFDRRVWEIDQTAPDNGWSGWVVLREADLEFGRPVLARNDDGRLEVFAVADQGGWAVWHAWQATPAASGRAGVPSARRGAEPVACSPSAPTTTDGWSCSRPRSRTGARR